MESSPGAFDRAAPFRLEFGVSEATNSTEENPILRYERNGFVFQANVNVIKKTVEVTLYEKREDSLDRDWQVLIDEVRKQAEEELQKRHEVYMNYFA